MLQSSLRLLSNRGAAAPMSREAAQRAAYKAQQRALRMGGGGSATNPHHHHGGMANDSGIPTREEMRSAVGAALFRSLVNNVNAAHVPRRAEDGEVTAAGGGSGAMGGFGGDGTRPLKSGVRESTHMDASFTPAQAMQFIDVMGAKAVETQGHPNVARWDVATKGAGVDDGGLQKAAMGRSVGLAGFLKTHSQEVRMLKRLRRNALAHAEVTRHQELRAQIRLITERLEALLQRELSMGDNGYDNSTHGGRVMGRGGRGGRGGGGSSSADPVKERHMLSEHFQQFVGRLTPTHYANADVDVLLRLLQVCSKTSFVDHTSGPILSCAQLLQQSARGLSHRDLTEIVLAIAAAPAVADQGSVGQMYLDWFLEYLIGAERMGPEQLGVKVGGSNSSSTASTSSSSTHNSSSQTDHDAEYRSRGKALILSTEDPNRRGKANLAPLWKLVPHRKMQWLLELMLDRQSVFVRGHCQAFILKLLQAINSPMEPCAVKYQELRRSADEKVDEDEEDPASDDPHHTTTAGRKSSTSPQQRIMRELKEAQHKNAEILERTGITPTTIATMCAAIIAFKVETVEALDFFIAAAPICLEHAILLRPSDMANILLAFVTVGYRDVSFIAAIGDEVARRSEELSDDDAGKIIAALDGCGYAHDNLRMALESSRRMRDLTKTNLKYTTTAD